MRARTIVLLFCLILAGCSGGKKEKEQTQELAKGEFKTDTTEVGIMVLQKIPFKRQLVSNGRVRARNKSMIGFKTSGTIARIFVANGDWVRAGEVLAVLDTLDAVNALQSSLLGFEKAKINLHDKIIGAGYTGVNDTVPEKIMALVRLNSGFIDAELSLQNARRNVDACTLRAPFAGKVANLTGHLHERSSADFCTIIDDQRLIVDFAVLETELDFVRKGSRVRVASFFNPEKFADGVVTSVNPTVNDQGQVTVEAEIPNDGTYIDGMNIRIYVESEMADQLVVPKSAVVMRDNLEVLFRYSNNQAQWTYVHTLHENSEEYVVTANTVRGAELSVGDSVIVSGSLNLADRTVVKIAGGDFD
jgi:multidrug efflux pump subunit AcrA (membrane-fusion protein)